MLVLFHRREPDEASARKLGTRQEPCGDSRLGCPAWAKPGRSYTRLSKKKSGRGSFTASAFQEDRTLKLAQAQVRHPPPEPESLSKAISEHSPVKHSPAPAEKPQLEPLQS